MTLARKALSGNAGVVFVTGEAGIGKTSLVQELFHRLQEESENIVIATGRCTIESVSYLPFRSIIEDLLENRKDIKVSGEIAGRKRDKVRDTVVDIVKEVGTDVMEIFLPKTIAKIAGKGVRSVFGGWFPKHKKGIADISAPKELEQGQIFGWYTRVMKNISEKLPLVLFIDDLHWADTSSLNLLLHLGREIEKKPMLVIGTYRPYEIASNSPLIQIKNTLGRYGAKDVSLDISEDQSEDRKKAAQFVHKYLTAHYSTNFSNQFEQLLVERTEGNPLFLSEILKNLEEKGQISPLPIPSDLPSRDGKETQWQLTATIERLEDLPEKVEYAIKERVDRLGESLREVLDYASAEGEDFIAQVIAKVRKIDEVQFIDELIEELVKFHQLVWARGGKSLPSGGRIHEYAFKHNLIRRYVYDQLSEPKRERIHAKLGECLELLYKPASFKLTEQSFKKLQDEHIPKDVLATLEPLENEEFLDEEEFLDVLEKHIGEEHTLRYETAILKHAYEPNADEIALQLAVHFYQGHIPDKAVHYCLKAAEDANRHYGASEAVRFINMGLEALEEQAKTISQEKYSEDKLKLLLELAKAEEFGGEQQEEEDHIQMGIAYLEEHLHLLDGVSDEYLRAEIYAQLGRLYKRKGATKQKAQEKLEEALHIYEQSGNKKNTAEILYQLAHVYPCIPSSEEDQSPFDKSIEALEKSLSIAKELDDVQLQSRCLSRLAREYNWEDFAYAEDCAKQALDLSRTPGKSDKYAELTALIAMARVYRGKAKYKTGIRALEEALELARKVGDRFLEAEILGDLGYDYGRYVTLQGKAQEALEKSVLIGEEVGSGKFASPSALGWIFIRQGRWKRAEACFQKAMKDSGKLRESLYKYHIGLLHMFRGEYAQIEREINSRSEILEQYKKEFDLGDCGNIAQYYALSGNETLCKKYMAYAQSLLERNICPVHELAYLYGIAEAHRLLGELEPAKAACQEAIKGFLTHAEDAEGLVFVAEARLIMGKILVDMQEYEDALLYLEKTKADFETSGHYALGETLLYLGKACQSLGEPKLLHQAREHLTAALSEFHRLELHHQVRNAQEVLDKTPE